MYYPGLLHSFLKSVFYAYDELLLLYPKIRIMIKNLIKRFSYNIRPIAYCLKQCWGAGSRTFLEGVEAVKKNYKDPEP